MRTRRSMMVALSALAATQLAWSQITVPNGTKLSCRLEQTVSSATAEEGQQVQLSVTEAVKVNGVVVIPQGAPVLGSVVLAQGKRSMGRSGKLDFSVDKVRAADGEFVPLRYHMNKKQGEGKGMSTGIMTAGAVVLFWPAAPFFLMRKGKDVTINKGIVFEVFTDQDHTIGNATMSGPVAPAPPQSLAPGQPQVMLANQQSAAAGTTAAVQLAEVNITSDMAGAEVEVDGVFVGSTPASAKLAPGVHKIVVKHGSAAWSRDLMVQPGGNVNVNAILKK